MEADSTILVFFRSERHLKTKENRLRHRLAAILDVKDALFVELIAGMLELDPSKRYSAQDCLNHKFIEPVLSTEAPSVEITSHGPTHSGASATHTQLSHNTPSPVTNTGNIDSTAATVAASSPITTRSYTGN